MLDKSTNKEPRKHITVKYELIRIGQIENKLWIAMQLCQTDGQIAMDLKS